MSDSPLDLTDGADTLPPRVHDRGGRSALPDFEQQWINDYLAGDDSAFISFYHRYRAQVYRYLLAHLPTEAANRLFVQAWLDFIRNARDIPSDISPGAAVFAEAHRLVLEGYRALDKSLLLSFADGVVETAGEVPASGYVENTELEQTRLATLPPAWREALQLYLETGFDGESLAYALHVGRETARSRLKRAFSMWRKLWPDGDNGVEDTLLRSTQHWIFRYRSLVSCEPPDYLDARILRQADWQTHWLPRMIEHIDRYWHIALTAILTGLGVFGYLWTITAAPDYTLELSPPPQPAPQLAAPPADVKPATVMPAVTASAPAASVPQTSASGAIASAVSPVSINPAASAAMAPTREPAARKAAAPSEAPSTRAASAAVAKPVGSTTTGPAKAAQTPASAAGPGSSAPASAPVSHPKASNASAAPAASAAHASPSSAPAAETATPAEAVEH